MPSKAPCWPIRFWRKAPCLGCLEGPVASLGELVAGESQGAPAWGSGLGLETKSRPKCFSQCNDFSSNKEALGAGDGLFQPWEISSIISPQASQLDALKPRRPNGLLEMRQEGPCPWKLGNNVLPTGGSEAAPKAQESHRWLFLVGAPSGGESWLAFPWLQPWAASFQGLCQPLWSHCRGSSTSNLCFCPVAFKQSCLLSSHSCHPLLQSAFLSS